jgi:hypothetical protein
MNKWLQRFSHTFLVDPWLRAPESVLPGAPPRVARGTIYGGYTCHEVAAGLAQMAQAWAASKTALTPLPEDDYTLITDAGLALVIAHVPWED